MKFDILTEDIDNLGLIYQSKCGFVYDSAPIICGGISTSPFKSIIKAKYELYERYYSFYRPLVHDKLFVSQKYFLFKDVNGTGREKIKADQILWGVNDNPLSDFNIDATGLAAHIDTERAIKQSVLEIFERDRLYHFWYNSNPLIQIDGSVPINKKIKLLLLKKNWNSESFIISNHLESGTYTVITILKDQTQKITLGSSCSNSLIKAIEKSLLESIMLRLTMEVEDIQNPNDSYMRLSNVYTNSETYFNRIIECCIDKMDYKRFKIQNKPTIHTISSMDLIMGEKTKYTVLFNFKNIKVVKSVNKSAKRYSPGHVSTDLKYPFS